MTNPLLFIALKDMHNKGIKIIGQNRSNSSRGHCHDL